MQAPIGENTDCWQVWFTSLFWSAGRAAVLVSRVSQLRRSALARACTALTKSEQKERLLTVYHHLLLLNFIVVLRPPSHFHFFFYQTGYLDGLWVLLFTFGLFLACVFPFWAVFGLSDYLQSNLSGRRTIEMRRRRENNRNVVASGGGGKS